MKEINIITTSFFDISNNVLKIGGLETYIKDLALLAIGEGYTVRVFQLQKTTNNIDNVCFNGITIIPYCLPSAFLMSSYQKSFDNIYKCFNKGNAKFIIATDQLDIKSSANNVIAIQHGIAFDLPGYLIPGFWGKNRALQFVNKFLRCIKNVQRFYHTKNTVCVDYNYYNWFRTLGTIYPGMNLVVIPNYASSYITKQELLDKLQRTGSKKKILFARRFVDYRGALLFADVVERLLLEGQNIEVTFAGNGPLEQSLKDRFKQFPMVQFTSFYAGESITFHKKYDIAIVPTIYSEGTSLSLCEAMAAGCFPIATHVGGITNIILDGYNGLLSEPSVDGVYGAIMKCLHFNQEEYNSVVIHSYDTVCASFVKKVWEDKWRKIL